MRRALAMLLLLASTAARAEDCGSKDNQADMNECFGRAYQQTDATLNVLYRQILDRLKGDDHTRGLFVSAQRAWLAYRDGECTFVGSLTEGGSIHPTILATCLEGETAKRVADFKAYLSCQEGDLSCPVPAHAP